ncbi:MAG TPA: M28 family peptidase [Gammaproteobacteria bacterium]|nr:M28 family peptidase [Gammaproteobacteria bacterium]
MLTIIKTSRSGLFVGLLVGLVFLTACEQPQDVSQKAAFETSWGKQVALIAAGEDSAARGDAIIKRLEALGLTVETRPFESEDYSGENIVAYVSGPANAPLILIGAHYDKVSVGAGATDNASGSAAVLELAKAFKITPLENYRVAVVFWDHEEVGLLGSKAWIAKGQEKPALYINFDVFGWGDTVWMMSPDNTTPLATSLASAVEVTAKRAGLNASIGKHYPPTDHRAFLAADWPAVSFSLVGGDEITKILAMYSGEEVKEPPKVMRVIHSASDQPDQVKEKEVVKAIPVIETAIRQMAAAPSLPPT